jgi:hypothetical protein
VVFGGEYGFAGVDEGQVLVAFVVADAFFDDREVEVGDQVGDLIGVVFSATASPRACAKAAMCRLTRSWSAAVSGNPVSLA